MVRVRVVIAVMFKCDHYAKSDVYFQLSTSGCVKVRVQDSMQMSFTSHLFVLQR